MSQRYGPVDCYLGMDFFAEHKCDFSVQSGEFTVGGKKVQMEKEGRRGKLCARVKAQEDFLIPPRSETVIEGRAERSMKRALAPWAILQPSQRVRTLQKSGINIGSALTGAQLTTVPVPLVNTSDKEYLIRKGTTLAVMRPTTNIQEWDDREAPGGTASVRAMSRETREDAPMTWAVRTLSSTR